MRPRPAEESSSEIKMKRSTLPAIAAAVLSVGSALIMVRIARKTFPSRPFSRAECRPIRGCLGC